MSDNGMSAGPRPHDRVLVLFGGTGDLARRKLLPGLFHLHVAGLLPREYRIVGSAPPSFALPCCEDPAPEPSRESLCEKTVCPTLPLASPGGRSSVG